MWNSVPVEMIRMRNDIMTRSYDSEVEWREHSLLLFSIRVLS